jgi:hypothetical protein
MKYANIEKALGLHERLEFLYVVTGWTLTFSNYDGDYVLCQIEAESIEKVMELMDAWLENYDRDLARTNPITWRALNNNRRRNP